MQKLKSLPVLTFSSSSPTTSAPSPSNALPSPLSPGNGAGSRSGSRAGSRSRRPGTPKEKDSRARSVSPSPFRRSFGSLSQAIRGERERESVDSGAESDGESVVGAMMRERRGAEESDSDSDSRDGDFERVDGQSSSESEEEWTEEVKGNTEDMGLFAIVNKEVPSNLPPLSRAADGRLVRTDLESVSQEPNLLQLI
ncbi:hypothetical protein BT69DRAFT_1327432 [Atractiella rhizophila]|nr:hypothetical protein BT69DRAFT_1327432 [Atractiella rhizophila]